MRRPAGAAREDSLADGFRESMPFLFLGAVFLVLAVWMFAVNTAPVGGLPIWILFAGIGVIALTGGFVGAFLAGDADETEPSARPLSQVPARATTEAMVRSPPIYAAPESVRPPARRPWVTASPPASRTAPIAARPREIVPDRASRPPAPRPTPLRAPTARPAPPPPSRRLPPDEEAYREDDLMEVSRPARRTDSVDDILQSLDDLSSYLAAPRPPTQAAPSPPEPSVAGGMMAASRSCAGCEDPIPGGSRAASCRDCGLPICPNCLATAVQQGHEGVCPTCAVLDAVAAGARAS